MRQNLEDVTSVARFAKHNGLEVFYQPIEQNYNTAEDSRWFEHGPTWPENSEKAIAVVKELCELKREGFPIVNTLEQLEVMIPYFADPKKLRVAVQSHTAHERQLLCSAMTMLQIQANGDVRTCISKEAVGNIKLQPIKTIWRRVRAGGWKDVVWKKESVMWLGRPARELRARCACNISDGFATKVIFRVREAD